VNARLTQHAGTSSARGPAAAIRVLARPAWHHAVRLMFWAVVLASGPDRDARAATVNEFFTIQKAVNKIAHDGGTTVRRSSAFDKAKEIEYSISSISSKDLSITKENEQVVISFAYDKEIELMAPVYLLIKYQGVQVAAGAHDDGHATRRIAAAHRAPISRWRLLTRALTHRSFGAITTSAWSFSATRCSAW